MRARGECQALHELGIVTGSAIPSLISVNSDRISVNSDRMFVRALSQASLSSRGAFCQLRSIAFTPRSYAFSTIAMNDSTLAKPLLTTTPPAERSC